MEAGILTWLMASPYGQYFVAGLTILGALVTIASAIVPFTATPKDDELLAKAKEFMARFSLFSPKETK
jgi:hypothetical protein